MASHLFHGCCFPKNGLDAWNVDEISMQFPLLASVVLASAVVAFPVAADEMVDYRREVKPLLKARCFGCHGALKQEAGLRLDSAELIGRGGDGGAVLSAGEPEESTLVERVTTNDASLRMPPEGKPLTREQVETLRAWIAQGAHAPDDDQPEPDPREHWAFKRPVKQPVPSVKATSWNANPIDAFIAQRHEQKGLSPLPQAEKAILLRRVHLDLVGLPPSREELHDYLADDSADAYERVVKRLLDSRHYGERWGRHWMDVWRYSDWYGRRQVGDVRNSYPHIWRWRDWIIDSLNEDKGYDQMVREMLAADELYPDDDTRISALGFIVRNWFSLNYDTWKQDLVEHTGKAFLGLRLNCAHCHDHKYDPISQEEYFRFRAFFEPLELRHDRVPGGPALAKYTRYKPGVSSSLKPIKAGLPRVYDFYQDEKTYMYRLGDTRDRFDRPPVSPAPPEILGGAHLTIEPVELPLTAWYPAHKSFIQKEEREKREAAVSSARDALKKAESPNGVLEAELVAAQTELTAYHARVAADLARYKGAVEDGMNLAAEAASAERAAKLGASRAKLARREAELAALKAADQADEKKLTQAEQKAAAARKELAALEEETPKDATEYTPLGPQYPRTSTGRRRALANWLGSDANPLTARVAVNHIWMRHFGRPLMETVFDFGRGGKQPTHPALLDWLAVELMEHDWSMKHLHQLIVTSNTFRLSSRTGGAENPNSTIDGENVYWWKFDRRRLEGEIIRDSMLYVAGQLDTTIGGPEIQSSDEMKSRRRSLYFTVYPEAGGGMRFLTLFDPADPAECYRRGESIVPQQALAMVNSEMTQGLGRKLALAMTKPLASAAGDREFVSFCFEQMLSRRPSEAEQAACLAFLVKQRQVYEQANTEAPPAEGQQESAGKSAEPLQRARDSLVRVLFNHNDFIMVH